METVLQTVKRAFKERKMSLRKASALTGITLATLHRRMSGKAPFTAEDCLRIGFVLSVSGANLYHQQGEEQLEAARTLLDGDAVLSGGE